MKKIIDVRKEKYFNNIKHWFKFFKVDIKVEDIHSIEYLYQMRDYFLFQKEDRKLKEGKRVVSFGDLVNNVFKVLFEALINKDYYNKVDFYPIAKNACDFINILSFDCKAMRPFTKLRQFNCFDTYRKATNWLKKNDFKGYEDFIYKGKLFYIINRKELILSRNMKE